jgi:predicted solute-binding protein
MPFVFATWAVERMMPEEQKQEIARSLESSLDQSVGRYGEIGREHGKKLGMTSAEVENYLNAYTFRFGENEHKAIDAFRAELVTLGAMEIGKVEA